jgi:hypothetical protein
MTAVFTKADSRIYNSSPPVSWFTSIKSTHALFCFLQSSLLLGYLTLSCTQTFIYLSLLTIFFSSVFPLFFLVDETNVPGGSEKIAYLHSWNPDKLVFYVKANLACGINHYRWKVKMVPKHKLRNCFHSGDAAHWARGFSIPVTSARMKNVVINPISDTESILPSPGCQLSLREIIFILCFCRKSCHDAFIG